MVKLLVFALLGVAGLAQKTPPAPPIAKVIPTELSAHGETRVDPYYWLQDPSNPEVIHYLEAENRYAEAIMKDTEPLQQQLYQEMLSRTAEKAPLSILKIRDYYYYGRLEPGKQLPVFCRKRGSLSAPEELIFDPDELSKEHRSLRPGAFKISPDQRFVALAIDTSGGAEAYTIFLKDLGTGRVLSEAIPNADAMMEWAGDSKTLFYTTSYWGKPPYRVLRHVLGTKSEADALVYEGEKGSWMSLSTTKSGEYLLVAIGSDPSQEVRYLPAHQPDGPLQIIEPRRPGVGYYVRQHGRSFFIATNDAGADFRVVRAPVEQPSRAHWEEVIPHHEGVKIEDIDAFVNHLVVAERKDGVVNVRVLNLKTGDSHDVRCDEPACSVWPSPGFTGKFDTNLLHLSYLSFITPRSVYAYDMDTKRRKLVWRQQVPGYDPRKYQSERLWAMAPDGVKVPISLVYRKPLVRDGKRPLLLYGYGSHGLSSDPSFASERVCLLDRGVIYAIAHVRGGSEMGAGWYEGAKGRRKMNTFTDFIACAEHLVREKYTSPDRIAAMGRSSGGLLMGVVSNLRPDLFKAVVAEVPWAHIITQEAGSSRLWGVGEFGDPNEKGDYEYIRSYSPYDNVKRQAYPNLLITGGFNDARIEYWMPAKWAARLRAMKTDNNILLLKTDMAGGHSGAAGAYDRLKEISFEYAFLLKALGISQPSTAKSTSHGARPRTRHQSR